MAKNSKQLILNVTFQLLAQKGFEGLRTREIAEIVGVNHATIHYHFKDKETLIRAVAEDLIEKVYEFDTAQLRDSDLSAREKIKGYFRNNLIQRKQHPERFIVMSELAMRGSRSPEIREIMIDLEQNMYDRMQAAIQDGIDRGELSAQLDPEITAILLISLLRGIQIRSEQSNLDQMLKVYQLLDQTLFQLHSQ